MAAAYVTATTLKTRMGITDTNSDAILGAIATAVCAMVESYIGAPVADGGYATRYFDGNGESTLYIRQGIRADASSEITVSVADKTGGTFTTLAAGEYVIRPLSHDRPTGWPGFWLVLTDAAVTYGTFTPGFNTVKIQPTQGVSGWGWSAIPSDLSSVAEIMATRMFQARQSGEMMVVGSTDFGQAIVRFLPEPEYRFVMDRYRSVVSPWISV